MTRLLPVALAAAVLLLSGFKAEPQPDPAANAKPTIIDVSGPRPEWICADVDTYAQDEKAYYRVVLVDQRDLGRGMEAAKARGFRAIRESVMVEIGSAFEVRTDAVKTELTQIAKGLELPGLKQEASWWEKTLSRDEDGELVPAYKIYVLVSIPEKYLTKAQERAARAALGVATRTRDKQAQGALEETLAEVKASAQEGPAAPAKPKPKRSAKPEANDDGQ